MQRTALIALGIVLLVPWTPGELRAQTDAEYLSAVNFRFVNPGARARGMGGVLVPLADDDATAAFVNPAGLAFFDDWQVTLEAVAEEDEFAAPRLETGFVNGQPARSPRRPTIESDSSFVSFASFVPSTSEWRNGNRYGLSVFYANLLDTDSGSVETVIDAGYFPSVDPSTVFFASRSSVSAQNQVLGASFGVKLTKEFAVGIALGLSEFDFRGQSRRESFITPGQIVNRQLSVVDQESAVFVTVGALWQIADRWRVGGSWQKQTSYDMTNSTFVTELGVETPDRTFDSEFTIPTRTAFGIAYRSENWTVGLEADFIQYSDLLSETSTFFGQFSEDSTYGYQIDDVVEIHAGVERIFDSNTEGNSWSLRAGYWRDETHVPYYTGTAPLERAWAPQLDETIDHWTLGAGFEAQRFAFGVAADFSSDAGTDVLASVIFRGPGA